MSIAARAIQVQTKLACWNPSAEENKNVEMQTHLAMSTEAVIVQCLATNVSGKRATEALRVSYRYSHYVFRFFVVFFSF